MSWHNLSGKDFDAKIKSYAEAKEPPYDSNAWGKMNHKLNLLYPSNSNSKNGNSWSLLSILLLLSALFFWSIGNYSGYSQPIEKNQNSLEITNEGGDTKPSQLESPNKMVPEGSSEEEKSATTDLTKNAQPVEEPQELSGFIKEDSKGIDDAPAATVASVSKEDDVLNSSHNLENTVPKSPANDLKNQKKIVKSNIKNEGVNNNETNSYVDKVDQNSITNTSKDKKHPGLENTGNRLAAIATSNLSADDSETPPGESSYQASLNKADEGKGTGSELKLSYGQLAEVHSLGPDMSWMKLKSMPNQMEQYPVENPPIVTKTHSKWSLGIGYAPDLSLVGFSELTSPGTNVSLSVDFQLGNRWSIQTGATFAKKRYIANGEDYKPPSGFWDYGVIPDRADATCTVIDIPINVRYYFKHRKNHRFYASTGLSTYLMLRENYDYSYEQNYPSLIRNWNVRNENQHAFGIYNLSFGYQRAISNNWSLEIEPFVKAPLSGIGFGRVNLWSTGTMFSLRFKIP